MLFDELYTSTFPEDCGYPGLARLREAVVFDINAVARYVIRTYMDEGRPVDLVHDLPTVAPPAPVCWLEYDGSGAFGNDYRRLAVLLVYQDLGPQLCPERYPEAHWLLDVFPIAEHPDHSITVDDFVITFLLDGEGTMLAQGQHDYHYKHLRELWNTPQLLANAVKGFPALLAVTFSHVHGVEVTEHQPPRQQRRAWARGGHKEPLVQFRTIDIDPVVRRVPAGPRANAGELRRALTYVRGHLRHYPPGTYMGRKNAPAITLHIPLHLRGSSEEGVRFHDYRIHPPRS